MMRLRLVVSQLPTCLDYRLYYTETRYIFLKSDFHRKNLTISTTVRIYRMISEAETSKRILFTCPSEIFF